MASPSRSQLLGTVALGLVVVVLGALWARGGAGPAAGTTTAAAASGPATLAVDDAPPGRGTIVVHIAGAVRHPGVYRVRDGTRVAEAIRRAGGAARRANLDALNLAAKLADGRQVLVPAKAAPAPAGAPAAASAPAGAALPVNLNSASAEELDALDGVGPATAQKIVDYREEHGGFGSVDELDQVDGIGPARLAALRDQVTA